MFFHYHEHIHCGLFCVDPTYYTVLQLKIVPNKFIVFSSLLKTAVSQEITEPCIEKRKYWEMDYWFWSFHGIVDHCQPFPIICFIFNYQAKMFAHCFLFIVCVKCNKPVRVQNVIYIIFYSISQGTPHIPASGSVVPAIPGECNQVKYYTHAACIDSCMPEQSQCMSEKKAFRVCWFHLG